MASNIKLDTSKLSYTSRDYQSIFDDLFDAIPELTTKWNTEEETDPGIVLLKFISMAGDMLSYNLDKKVLEVFPATVQERFNGEQVFGLTGYKMPWFRSSTCEVTIHNLSESYEIIVPKFVGLSTNVYNGKESVDYILINDYNLSVSAGDTETYKAVEGIMVAPDVNKDLFLTNEVDIWHRPYGYNVYSADIVDNCYYFQSYSVEQDYMWLVDSNDNVWKKVDDLDLENTTEFCYEFKTDSTGPRIELNENWNKNGDISFKLFYILSSGSEGKIFTNQISNLDDDLYYKRTVDNEDDTTTYSTVDSSMYRITNTIAEDGYYPQTCNEARVDYKKYQNTLDTLITLDDFQNAVKRDNRVLNAYATDIQTDPNQWSGHELTDFQVRVYVVRKDSDIDDTVIIADLQEIMHKYKTIIRDVDIVIMNEDGDIDNHNYHYYYWQPKATLFLTHPVTIDIANDILNNINKNLSYYFDLNKIDFNETPKYLDVVKRIQESSPLINIVNLNEVEYFSDKNLKTKVNEKEIVGVLTEDIEEDKFISKHYTEDAVTFDFYLLGENAPEYYKDIQQPIYPGSVVIKIGNDVITDNYFGELVSYKKDVLADTSQGETFTNFIDYSTGRVRFTLTYEDTADLHISFELNRVNICKYNENALNSIQIAPEYLR